MDNFDLFIEKLIEQYSRTSSESPFCHDGGFTYEFSQFLIHELYWADRKILQYYKK